MSEAPWIAFYPSDWIGGVAKLSGWDELVYFKVCLMCWTEGRGIHQDDVENLFSRRDPDPGPSIERLLRLEKLTKGDDGLLVNRRAIETHQESTRLIDAKKAGGRKGGRASAELRSKHSSKHSLKHSLKQKATQPQPHSHSESHIHPESHIEPNGSCAEPHGGTPPETVKEFIRLPLVGNGAGEAIITSDQVETWKKSFPNVDVPQQLRNMKEWLTHNPKRRKTNRGIGRFVVAWLVDKQDKGGKSGKPTLAEQNFAAAEKVVAKYRREELER